jgi:prepilin-type N-terminal cleavage/methylation domain-containing protein/prepilin-type processing-associated H-X9-DG protein
MSRHSFTGASSARRAFTLVELLVVIGIIALLISILLPALSRARESAKTVTCLSNLRQMGQAAMNYASSNSGIWPPCAWWDGAPGTESESWPNVLVNAGFLNAPDVAKGQSPISKSVFYCPSGNPDFNAAFTSSNGPTAVPSSKTDGQGQTARVCTSKSSGMRIYVWYGVNGSTGDADLGSIPLIRTCGDNATAGSTNFAKYLTKQNMIRRSADIVYLFDGIYMNLGLNSARINARHGRSTQTNLLMFDGHAATFKTEQLPGGLGVGTGTDFTLANLNTYSLTHPGMPKWRINQN